MKNLLVKASCRADCILEPEATIDRAVDVVFLTNTVWFVLLNMVLQFRAECENDMEGGLHLSTHVMFSMI